MIIDTVNYLGADYGYRFFRRVLDRSDDARAVSAEMERQGLEAQPERTQVFSTFSPDSLQSIAISVTPYTSRDFTREGGLSLSEGGHAQGVVVDISDRTALTGFTHIAIREGEVVTSSHDIRELLEDRPDEPGVDEFIRIHAEQAGKIRADRPLVEIEARQVRSLAAISYNSLLSDDFAGTVHNEDEITMLRGNTSLVADIGMFVLFRTSGSACCSCSCSCWGSSSCSCSYVG